MTVERTRRILELAESLLELDPAEQQAELVRLEPDDADLRAEVLEILAHAPAEADAPADAFPGPLLRRLVRGRTPESLNGEDAFVPDLPDRYELGELVGRGGASWVFRAVDRETGSAVAIKVMREIVESGLPPRARRESRIARGLQHSGIVPVIGSGRAGNYSYLVMPFVGGGTLRDRINGAPPLRIEEAVEIVLKASSALTYAHGRSVFHRDIKPENFLMDGEDPLLTDFGIAREGEPDPNTFQTSHGYVVGTVSYMAPERQSGPGDGLSDQYSLGCVLYELLTGEPPFLGNTRESILNKHVTDPPGSPKRLRPAISDSIVEVLDRALAKSPGDRFPSMEEFASALAAADSNPATGWRTEDWPRRVAVAGAAAALVLLAIWGGSGLFDRTELDPNRIAVFPSTVDAGATRYDPLDRALADAIGFWDEVTAVDERVLFDALRSESDGPLSLARAADLAADLGAGRFVLPSSPAGESGEYDAALYPSEGAARAQARGSTAVSGLELSEAAALQLSDRLLAGARSRDDGALGPVGTSSLRARMAFADGLEATNEWDLDTAIEQLRQAIDFDESFPIAHLALARARHWRGDPVNLWGASAQIAANADGYPTDASQLEAVALQALVDNAWPDACDAFEALSRERPDYFGGWFGQGDCRWRDDLVVRDDTSPTGWRFRSSRVDAARHFETAFSRDLASLSAFRAGSYGRLTSRLLARRATATEGRDAEGGLFLGFQVLDSDTLAHIALPWGVDGVSYQPPALEAIEGALAQQRARVRVLTGRWIDRTPLNPDAMYALSVALEMLADPAAVDSLRRARELETDETQRRELAATQAWVLIKQGVGVDSIRIQAAVAIADTLLRTVGPSGPANPILMASLAAVTGRTDQSAEYQARAAYTQAAVPEQLLRATALYTQAAAAGASPARLAQLEEELSTVIDAIYVGDQVRSARAANMERAAFLAFPTFESRLFREDTQFQSPIARAQAAWIRGDRLAAEAELAVLADRRINSPPSAITIDVLYPEARLRMVMGDTVAAIEILAPALEDARWIEPGILRQDPVKAALLLRVLTDFGVSPGLAEHPLAGAWTRDARRLQTRGSGGS